VQAQPLSLDEKCKKLEETIQTAATINTSERGKERRQRASHPNQNQRSQECLQTSPDKGEAFVQKRGKAA
jgi:hypothetical protein